MQRSRRKQHVTDFDRVISQPISNQTQIRQSSPAATERQPQRCTRSIPYCQRTIHDARPWPASFRLPCSRTEYIITSTALAATAPGRAKAMTRLFRRAYHRERVDAAASALTLNASRAAKTSQADCRWPVSWAVPMLASLVWLASPAASCAIAQMLRVRLCLRSRQSLATTFRRPRGEGLLLYPATKTASHSQG